MENLTLNCVTWARKPWEKPRGELKGSPFGPRSVAAQWLLDGGNVKGTFYFYLAISLGFY